MSVYGVSIAVNGGGELPIDIEGVLAMVDAYDIIITTSAVTAHFVVAQANSACVLIRNGKGKFDIIMMMKLVFGTQVWSWFAEKSPTDWKCLLRLDKRVSLINLFRY